jgi:hypothetical protein
MAHLSFLTGLQWLYLNNTAVTDLGPPHLKSVTDLQALSLVGAKVTDAGLGCLKELTRIQALVLSGTAVSDAGLAELKGLVRLHTLGLDETGISDAGLATLAGIVSLRTLTLGGDSFPTVESFGHATKNRLPLAELGLAEEPHRGIPRAVVAHGEPAPIARDGKGDPDGDAEPTREMSHRRIGRDDQVERAHNGSRLGKVTPTTGR